MDIKFREKNLPTSGEVKESRTYNWVILTKHGDAYQTSNHNEDTFIDLGNGYVLSMNSGCPQIEAIMDLVKMFGGKSDE